METTKHELLQGFQIYQMSSESALQQAQRLNINSIRHKNTTNELFINITCKQKFIDELMAVPLDKKNDDQ